ncbi:DUF3054 domain-containing protein [Spirillospora sp. CA-294931]|uniref:DUF3054 domain-containing protein n=1 Tax=Spirillospora sp. CA-294931 TaxID=3240042 RepID=UPI003D93A2BA
MVRKYLAAGVDAAWILVFVGIGRASHDSGGLSGFAGAVWPFLVGLGIGWVVLVWGGRVEPLTLGFGVGVWGSALVGGMVLRQLAGQGTAFAFVVVASVFLFAGLVGWRGIRRWLL